MLPPAPDAHGRERGASLVELMVGVVAVSTIVGAILTTLLQQSRMRLSEQELYLAYLACRNTMEDIRAQPFSTIAALNGSGFDVLDLRGNTGGLQPVPGDADGLPGKITVAIDKSAGSDVIYMLTLEVDWKGTQDAQHFELKSLIGERKLQ